MLRSLRLVKNRVPFGVARRRASTDAQGTGAQGTGAQGTVAQGTDAQGTLPSVEKVLSIVTVVGIGYEIWSVREMKDDLKNQGNRTDALYAALLEERKLNAKASMKADKRYVEVSKKADERYVEESKKADERFFALLEEVKDIKRKAWW